MLLKVAKCGSWKFENKERAVETVRNGGFSLYTAFRNHSSPKATMMRHLNGQQCCAVENTPIIGSAQTILLHAEKESANHILKLKIHTFGTVIPYLRST
jgi:hypothetical protein